MLTSYGRPRNASRSLPQQRSKHLRCSRSVGAPRRTRVTTHPVLELLLPSQGFRVCVPDFPPRCGAASGLHRGEMQQHMQNSDQVDVVNGSCSRWWRHTALWYVTERPCGSSVPYTVCTALGVGSLAGILFSRTAPVECFVVFFSWVVILLFSFFAPCTRIRTIISASRTFSLLIRYDGYLASRGDKFLGRQDFLLIFHWENEALTNYVTMQDIDENLEATIYSKWAISHHMCFEGTKM